MGFSFVRRYETGRVSRIVLFLSLVVVTATAVSAAPVPPSSATALVFEFSGPVSEDAWQMMVAALRRVDLTTLLGRPVVPVQRKRIAKGTEFLDVIQVALSGECVAGRNFNSTGSAGPLGWVYLANERIQPFVSVDCSQIAKMIEGELRDRPLSERERIMAYAISYVIAHELAHIATQYPGHEETGLLKPHATKMDLLSGVPDVAKQYVLVSPKLAPCPASKSNWVTYTDSAFAKVGCVRTRR